MAAARIRLPAARLRRVEVDMCCRADRVIRIEDRRKRPFADIGACNRRGDSLTGHVGEHLVLELRGVRPPLADEIVIEPFPGDPLQLTEEVEPGIAIGIPPLRQYEMGSE